MATDDSSLAFAQPGVGRRYAMDATAGDCLEVSLPRWADSADVTFTSDGDVNAGNGTAGSVALTGTDGAAQATSALPVSAGAVRNVPCRAVRKAISADPVKLYFACDTSSGYAHVVYWRRT